MIDFGIPRECVYRTFDDHPGPCPRCGGSIKRHTAAFALGLLVSALLPHG